VIHFSEIDGGLKLARASVADTFHGDIEGEATLEYLLAYREDGSASFVGLERVVGRVGSRSGSFVLQHSGTVEGGKVQATWSVLPGHGTGELQGLRGSGGYLWEGQHGQPTSYTLDYDVA
jgi:hypothetical protein